MNRRSFLTAGAGFAALALNPEVLHAAAANQVAGDWSLGFADLEADLPRGPMRLVQGRAPAGLSGALYRNGSGRFRRPGGAATHWFDGDGLMRAFRLHDGQARGRSSFCPRQPSRSLPTRKPEAWSPWRRSAGGGKPQGASAASSRRRLARAARALL